VPCRERSYGAGAAGILWGLNDMKGQLLDLETLLRVPYVDPDRGFDVSPDGQYVAFAWNGTGRWEIYILSLAGDDMGPRQITSGPGAKHAPRWSPDGRRLAYAADLEGDECYDLWACDPSSDAHLNLTPESPDAILPNYCWSPDGQWIAFISDRSSRFDTYVMPSTGGRVRNVLSLPFPDWEVHWSPDGRWLAVVAETTGQDYGTFIVPIGGGEPRRITLEGEAICAKDASWSPDAQSIAFASDLNGRFDIGVYDLADEQITWVTEGEGDKDSPEWSPDGRRLAYVVNRGPVSELALSEVTGKPVSPKNRISSMRIEPGVHYGPRFTPDGANLIGVFDNPRHPCDLWLYSIDNGSFRQLTQSLPAALTDAPFTMPAEIVYPSLDGAQVPGVLYRPGAQADLPPAVITIHGGPNWLTQVTWDPLVQHMVSRGWVVLAPNYRGSTGYGRDWQLASRFDLGGVDTQDVVAGADYLAAEGLADPARIALTGRSWGGYLTMTGLTQYPERWAAGSAVVPFLNWFTSHANSREDLQHWDRENFGDPEKDYDLWYERSPFFFLERICAPVQLICGAHDVRCPASESLQAQDVLVDLGKPCELVLYPDEGHSFLKTENAVDAKRRRAAFLAKHLEGEDGGGILGSDD
jgi:dipeptidyl aminopeptidase/acylaminoacyl peptidase